MPSKPRFGAARTIEARLLTRLKFKLLHVLVFEHAHPRWTNRISNAAACLVHFIANSGETISSTSQFHMENKSQFSESFGTPHRAG